MNSLFRTLTQAEAAVKSGLLNTARLTFESAIREAHGAADLAFVSYQFGAYFWGEVGDGTAARSCFEVTVAQWKQAVAESGGRLNVQNPLLANAAENLMLLSLSFEEFDHWTEELRREAPREAILDDLVPQFQKACDDGEPWHFVMLRNALNYINPGAVAGAGAAASGACLFQLLIENRQQLRLPLQKWRTAVLGYVSATNTVIRRADELILERTGHRQRNELVFVIKKSKSFLDEYCKENSGDQELETLRQSNADTLRNMQTQTTGTTAVSTAFPTQTDSPATSNHVPPERLVYVVICVALGMWPFLTGAALGWKILGGFALLQGVLGVLATFAPRMNHAAVGVRSPTLMSAAPSEKDYRTFSHGCPQLRLRVEAVECDPFANATLLIRPTTLPTDPQCVTSFVKARLFTLMPAALNGVKHLRLEQHSSTSCISHRGLNFPEPAWFVSDGQATVGPLGFRHPVWDDAEKVFRFTLLETSFTSASVVDNMSSFGGSKASIVNEVATLYRDRVGEFSL